jgi:hypothetical protein
MWKSRAGSLVLISAAVAAACGPPREGACVLETPPSGAPYLRRMASLTAVRIPHPKQPVCTEEQRGARIECEAVDDLQALTGGGTVCGPSGPVPQRVCPYFPEGYVRRLPEARQGERPCGPAACPNVELLIEDEGNTTSRVIFYDDPSCHGGPPEPICAPARHDCYYRVLSVQTVLKGTL